MKKIPVLLLLLISIYLLQLSCIFFILDGAVWAGVAVIAFLATTSALTVFNLINAIRNGLTLAGHKGEQLALNRAILAFKILTIPFFLLQFIIFTLITTATVIIPMLIYLALVIPAAGVILAYVVVLSGSAQAIALLVSLHREGAIGGKRLAPHIILQLIFVLDVLDYLFLSSAISRKLRPGLYGSAGHSPAGNGPLGKYGCGVAAGIWMVFGYMLLLSNTISLLDPTPVRWLMALAIVAVCGFLLSYADRIHRNMLITVGITLAGWLALLLTGLGNLFNRGFGNVGGYLPGQAVYLFGGVLLIPLLLFSYFAARLMPLLNRVD